jgi:tetratricopeptide (TPR) repeat protein
LYEIVTGTQPFAAADPESTISTILTKEPAYDKAIRQLRSALEMDPNFRLAHIYLFYVYVQKGMYEEAISENAIIHAGTNAEEEARIAAALRKAYGESGERGFWQTTLDLQMSDFDAPLWRGEAYVHLNEKDQAFEWLRKAADEGHPGIDYIKADPTFDGLRSDPRYADLLRRLRLPQ